MQSPIFIFSLPRSGSTLLQRVLMSHRDVCSISEPWILLPQVYALKKEGSLSEYSSSTSYQALKDFVENLPNKGSDYNQSLRTFVLDLYSKQCKNNERYFLDKTPRYYLIIDEIVALFPDAKFIFLFRNPVQVYASIVKTWGHGRFNKVRSLYMDLVAGTHLLSNGFLKHRDKSISVNYEIFVTSPEKELKRISDYLSIEADISSLEKFSSQETRGTLGDPTGIKKYASISDQGLKSWKTVFNSTIRKKFALRLLKKINAEDLKTQGYDKVEICEEVKNLKTDGKHNFLRDIIDYFINSFTVKFKLNLLFSKKFSWVKKKYIS